MAGAATALSARDTVVVSEFDNRTGDAIFDGALTDAFSVQLRQSPFVNILPEQQLTATLRLMQRDVATPVTAEIDARSVSETAEKQPWAAASLVLALSMCSPCKQPVAPTVRF